jgi:hypothetical protein
LKEIFAPRLLRKNIALLEKYMDRKVLARNTPLAIVANKAA